jgi:hypothetical protein
MGGTVATYMEFDMAISPESLRHLISALTKYQTCSNRGQVKTQKNTIPAMLHEAYQVNR